MKKFNLADFQIPYGKQDISNEDIEAVKDVLNSDFITQGPKVSQFEESFSKYVGSKYAVSVSSGTAALHLSCLALGVNRNSKVISSPITFAASVNAIHYCNGRVDFCDIDPKSLTLDINQVREKLSIAPKGAYSGIIPVDFAGYPVNMEKFKDLADEFNLWLLEDSCHAPGGYFIDKNGLKQNCGNGKFADLAIFSFHPVKHITCGEGGMITTNNFKLYEKLKLLRSHGITKIKKNMSEYHGGWYYEMNDLGYNYRMPDILCALGISQLNRAEKKLKRRIELANNYNDAFKDLDLKTPRIDSKNKHAFHLYVIQLENRKGLYEYLKKRGINTQVHYIPIHKLPFYERLYGKQTFTNSEQYYSKCLSLPLYPSLEDKEQDFIIKEIKNFLS